MSNKFVRNIVPDSIQGFKLGVALSGGGARGLAHAGALKAIEEAGFEVDIISGVSAGSIVAVLYAAGLKPDTILEMFKSGHFFDFASLSAGKGGLLSIDKFVRFCTRCLGKYRRLEDLKIPTYIGLTDFDKAEPVVFSRGDIAPLVKASCSIPVVIAPVIIDGTCYVDGGVLRNLPAYAIREQCDKLIGINVSPLMPKKTVPSLLGMALRSYMLLSKSNQQQDMDMCDITVKMDELTKYNVFSLGGVEEIFDYGYAQTKAILDKHKLV